MLNKLTTLINGDLIKSGLIKKELGFISILFLSIIYKTARVSLFIRLKQIFPSSKFLSNFILGRRFIDIGNCIIGKNLLLPHPWCIIIANETVIGNNVTISQYVTLGGNFKKKRMLEDDRIMECERYNQNKEMKLPIIGNNVVIGPGSVIGGPVVIGDNVIVGANSVVTKDVPANSIVFGQNQIANKKILVSEQGGQYKIIK